MRLSSSFARACSGDMYATVPSAAPRTRQWFQRQHRLFVAASAAMIPSSGPVSFANPKSSTLACPRVVTKIFAGLMSRCTMPSACAASSASAISMASRQQRFHLQRTPSDPLPQRHAIQKLHGDEGSPVVLADFVNRADVGMVQRRRRPRLAPKALQRQRFARRIFGQELQRHQTAERRVLRLVDHAHAARAQRPQHAIVRDGLAGDRRMIPTGSHPG